VVNTISFDSKRRVEGLRKAQAEAIAKGKTSFVFDGNELDVKYAKFMLEFLDIQITQMGLK
jgi:hypothetical protein